MWTSFLQIRGKYLRSLCNIHEKYFNYRQERSDVTSSCRIRILFYIYLLMINYIYTVYFVHFISSLFILISLLLKSLFFLSPLLLSWLFGDSVSEKLFTLFWMQRSLDKMFDLIFIIIIFLYKLWVIWKCTFFHSFVERVFN